MSKKKKQNPVYSVRIADEISDTFKEVCEKMSVPHSHIISEYMKKFIVLNIDRESYKPPLLDKLDDIDSEVRSWFYEWINI